MDKQLINDSKYLSYLLRHNPSEVWCTIDKYGWVDVNTLCMNSKFTLSYLEEIVSQDTRYELSHDLKRIRAFHGHSVEGVSLYKEIKPKGSIYHGTSRDNYLRIKESGFISRMSRNYVHSSYNQADARRVGSRHGEPVILVIDAQKMFIDGYKFYESGDNVVLTEDIPARYIIESI